MTGSTPSSLSGSGSVAEYRSYVEQAAKAAGIPQLDNCALLVVDMLNDGSRPGGAFDALGLDYKRFAAIEPQVAELVITCKSIGIPIFYTTTIYDFRYLAPPMLFAFQRMGIQDGGIARKGSWGIQFVDSLPPVNDFRIVKSHYSAFAKGYSMVLPEADAKRIDEYFGLPAAHDDELVSGGHLTLSAYYHLAQVGDTNSVEHGGAVQPSLLQNALQARGVDTVICVGGSTHVCLASTVYSAVERGYQVILPLETAASEDEAKHWVFLHNFSQFSCIVSSLARLVVALECQRTEGAI